MFSYSEFSLLVLIINEIMPFYDASYVHCVSKKVYPMMFDYYFGKCGPIF